MRRLPSPLILAVSLVGAVAAPGCFRSLDESLIGSAGGSGGAGGAGSGGTAGAAGGSGGAAGSGGGSGGTAGAGAAGGSGGAAGVGGTGGTGGTGGGTGGTGGGTGGAAGSGPVLVPYSATRWPNTSVLGAGATPLMIATDADTAFRLQYDGATTNDGTVSKVLILGGSNSTLFTKVPKARDLAAPQGAAFVWTVGGRIGNQAGLIQRLDRDTGVTVEEITLASYGVGMAIAVDVSSQRAFVTTQGIPDNSVGLVGFSLASTTGEVLYTNTDPNQFGGDVTAADGCVYWVVNGSLWAIKQDGTSARVQATADTTITDVVGLASDTQNFYFTRANGEVYQRSLFSRNTCAPGLQATPEQRIAWGFDDNMGDVIAYSNTVAWVVKGRSTDDYAQSGIFTTPVGGGDWTQIAAASACTPAGCGIDDIDHGVNHVVFSTVNGLVRRVPKVAAAP